VIFAIYGEAQVSSASADKLLKLSKKAALKAVNLLVIATLPRVCFCGYLLILHNAINQKEFFNKKALNLAV
jgi:hypothetical protein